MVGNGDDYTIDFVEKGATFNPIRLGIFYSNQNMEKKIEFLNVGDPRRLTKSNIRYMLDNVPYIQ